MRQSKSGSLRKLVLMAALQLSTVWDLITTLLGILIILDSRNLVAVCLAVIGTLIVVAFSFATRSIWRKRSSPQERVTLIEFSVQTTSPPISRAGY